MDPKTETVRVKNRTLAENAQECGTRKVRGAEKEKARTGRLGPDDSPRAKVAKATMLVKQII